MKNQHTFLDEELGRYRVFADTNVTQAFIDIVAKSESKPDTVIVCGSKRYIKWIERKLKKIKNIFEIVYTIKKESLNLCVIKHKAK